MPLKQRELAPRDQIAMALSQLSNADLARLKRIAQMRSAGLSTLDWEDLLNEAIARTLKGTRRWPSDVPFIAFMAQTIRSIANEEWRRLRRENVSLETDLVAPDDSNLTSIDEYPSATVDIEREFIARQLLEKISVIFQGDPEAIAVIHGLAKGLSPEETQTHERINPTQYATAQRRIRRKLAREFF